MPIIDGDARRKRWVPPPRPDWVEQVNSEGRHLDLDAVVPLDENSLLSTARANTGLDDFGDDGWHEPFRVLVKALNEESRLTLTGRLLTRTDMLLALEGRLRIEDAYKRHPEIDDEQITAPLFIVGQGRTGTSILQNLLAEDPGSGTVRNWEVMHPCPPPEAATYRTDPRIEQADRTITMWNRVTPEIAAMHDFAGWSATESIHLQVLSFRTPAWFDSLWGQVPSYARYMAGQPETMQADSYRYEKRVLKLLQWRNPRDHWVLKSPFALSHLPKVLEVYPDAGFIWTHRDPVRAVASVVSLIGTLNYIRSDHPLSGDTLEILTNPELAAGLMSQPIGWLEDGVIPRSSLCNVQYQDFVRDPMGVVGQIYDFFGIELTGDASTAMRRYMDAHPRTGRPSHDYDLGSKEEIQMERAAFKTYQEYFDVPSEMQGE